MEKNVGTFLIVRKMVGKHNRYLFLLGLIPRETHDEIAENTIGQIQSAANNLQWEIVSGIGDRACAADVINAPYIGAYPFKYKKLFSPSSQLVDLTDKLKGENVCFFN
ncbi:MAG TPA: hypothetical protein H9715_05790, partial [Candidatus Merdibacter merdigallinarum]|nr:hypothetical protein [Candidatus Merdibacter merdigallinarum]